MRSKIAIALILALVAISCGANKKKAIVEEKPVPVTVAAVSLSDISITRTYTGTLEGWRQAKIYASIPEAVVELPVAEGGIIEAGQPVIILDKDGPASRLRQSEAMYREAKDNYEKMARLFEQGAISEQTYNNLKTNLEVAKANFEAARQQVELTSPISGILTDLAVNIGQYVPLGVPLATVAQTNRMRLTIYVDGASASFIKVSQKARIFVSTYSNSSFEGVVTEVARSADPETRLFRIELQIDNSDHRLSSGAFARATIVVEELKGVLTIPREAVFSTEGISKVYTLDGDRAKERTIEVGEGSADLYQVISGLSQGQNVIVLGRNQVEDGTLVKIVGESDSTSVEPKSKES